RLNCRRTQRGSQDGWLQNSSETRDLPSGQEVVAHEALDAILAAMPGVTHAGTDHRLKIEGQALFRPARHIVQVEPDGPQELPGAPAVACLLLRQDAAEIGQLAHGLGIEDVTRDPV